MKDKNPHLEGPKKKHDDHGIHASVPAKHPISQQHWEKHYNLSKPSENMVDTEGADFVAKNPTTRKTTHKKVNREDH